MYQTNRNLLQPKQRQREIDAVHGFIAALKDAYDERGILDFIEIIKRAGNGFNVDKPPLEVLQSAMALAEKLHQGHLDEIAMPPVPTSKVMP